MESSKPRIDYIDALRGITILLVIYSHISTLSIRTDHEISYLNSIFVTFRMPLFFFISGFFVYTRNYTLQLLKKRTKNRIVKQLYPTAVVFVLYTLMYFTADFYGGVFDSSKRGYWFTLTAVEFFLFVIPLLYFFSTTHKTSIRRINWIVISYGILGEIILILCSYFFSDKIVDLFGFKPLIKYYPYFIGGILMRINYNKVLPYLERWWLVAICFIIFISSFLILGKNISRLIMSWCAIYILFAVFNKLFQYKRIAENRLTGWIKYMGTMTLEIYLFHYFFVYPVRIYSDGSFLSVHINKPWEFLVFILIGFTIAAVIMGIVWLLKKMKIYNFIFPK